MDPSTHFPPLQPPVTDRDHTLGPADAPVTLVMYGDYECPYTALAHSFLKAVRENVGDQLRIVYRYFPLADIHPHAERAAEAVEAAARQGRFWEMSSRLFTHQEALTSPDLLRHAETVGLDLEQFLEQLRERDTRQRVAEDRHSGDQIGVTGTPTFYINGERFAPKFDLQGLAEALVERLERAG